MSSLVPVTGLAAEAKSKNKISYMYNHCLPTMLKCVSHSMSGFALLKYKKTTTARILVQLDQSLLEESVI